MLAIQNKSPRGIQGVLDVLSGLDGSFIDEMPTFAGEHARGMNAAQAKMPGGFL